MQFEWDEAKSDRNLRERGFSFAFAARIFKGPVIERMDTRKDYGEARTKAIGAVGENVLLLVYTDRGAVRRIISARPANQKERAEWRSFANH
jgi:uncharacterized DUF497 family protein